MKTKLYRVRGNGTDFLTSEPVPPELLEPGVVCAPARRVPTHLLAQYLDSELENRNHHAAVGMYENLSSLLDTYFGKTAHYNTRKRWFFEKLVDSDGLF